MLFTLVFLCDREPATLSADSWLEKMQHMHLSSCFIERLRRIGEF